MAAGAWRTCRARSGLREIPLNGIACPATDACVAVGTVGPTRGVASTEALWWNGRTWRLQHIPTLPGANLNAVSCASETDCVAVGASNAGTLAERWNGKDWTIQATPPPDRRAAASPVWRARRLRGAWRSAFPSIARETRSPPWPSGGTARAGPSSPPRTRRRAAASAAYRARRLRSVWQSAEARPGSRHLAERWNGRSWHIQPTPNPSKGGGLAAVSCTSTVACTAVAALGAAMRWNGTKWTIQPTPSTGSPGSLFNTVLCTSASSCTAAGELTDSSGHQFGTLAERWNGRSWHIQPTPVPPAIGLVNNFTAACPAQSTCIAAGGFENDGPGAKTLTEVWRGEASAAQPTPGAFSPRAHLGMAGCIRAAMGKGAAVGATATRIGQRVNAPMLQRSLHVAEIERIAPLCGTA